jgi:hypothetical protein
VPFDDEKQRNKQKLKNLASRVIANSYVREEREEREGREGKCKREERFKCAPKWVGFSHPLGGWVGSSFLFLPCGARCEARCEAGLYFLFLARHGAKRSAVRFFRFIKGTARSGAKRSGVRCPFFIRSFSLGGHGAKHGARHFFSGGGWAGYFFLFPF